MMIFNWTVVVRTHRVNNFIQDFCCSLHFTFFYRSLFTYVHILFEVRIVFIIIIIIIMFLSSPNQYNISSNTIAIINDDVINQIIKTREKENACHFYNFRCCCCRCNMEIWKHLYTDITKMDIGFICLFEKVNIVLKTFVVVWKKDLFIHWFILTSMKFILKK